MVIIGGLSKSYAQYQELEGANKIDWKIGGYSTILDVLMVIIKCDVYSLNLNQSKSTDYQ